MADQSPSRLLHTKKCTWSLVLLDMGSKIAEAALWDSAVSDFVLHARKNTKHYHWTNFPQVPLTANTNTAPVRRGPRDDQP